MRQKDGSCRGFLFWPTGWLCLLPVQNRWTRPISQKWCCFSSFPLSTFSVQPFHPKLCKRASVVVWSSLSWSSVHRHKIVLPVLSNASVSVFHISNAVIMFMRLLAWMQSQTIGLLTYHLDFCCTGWRLAWSQHVEHSCRAWWGAWFTAVVVTNVF